MVIGNEAMRVHIGIALTRARKVAATAIAAACVTANMKIIKARVRSDRMGLNGLVILTSRSRGMVVIF